MPSDMSFGSSFARSLKGATIVLSLLVPAAAQAAEAPFTNLKGTWAGADLITMASGTKENIRCRATYNVDPAGANLTIAALRERGLQLPTDQQSHPQRRRGDRHLE